MRKREAVAQLAEAETALLSAMEKLAECEAAFQSENAGWVQTRDALITAEADLLVAQAALEEEREWRRTAQEAALDAEQRLTEANEKIVTLGVDTGVLAGALEREAKRADLSLGAHSALAELVGAIGDRSTGPKRGTRHVALDAIAAELEAARTVLKRG